MLVLNLASAADDSPKTAENFVETKEIDAEKNIHNETANNNTDTAVIGPKIQKVNKDVETIVIDDETLEINAETVEINIDTETDDVDAEIADHNINTDGVVINPELSEINKDTETTDTNSETHPETISEELLEEEEEIFTTIVEVHHKRKKQKKRTLKIGGRKFDDFFAYHDESDYSYENSGEYYDHDYQKYPKIKKKRRKYDPYKAPNPPKDHYHDEYVEFHEDKEIDLDYLDSDHHTTIFRDVTYHPRRPIIRNPRDSRFFPGNEPAGVLGVNGRLIRFVRRYVNPHAFAIQGNSEFYHGP